MTLSIWRYAHLALAVVSSIFLIVLSITGVILAIDAVNERVPAYRTEDLKTISLAQSLTELRKVYPEIIEIAVDHNQFVSIDAIDQEGNTARGYIHPVTGKLLGEIKPKSDFVQWTTALHRSLFLKETGRILIGIVSFLLLLITISGIVLIAKRQQGLRNFFGKIHKDFLSQYFHVVSGRLLLIPIFILALTGTYLFMIRMDLIDKESKEIEHNRISEDIETIALEDFKIFNEIKLGEIEKIEFPFMPDDPEEHFIVKLSDRTILVSQINGEIVHEARFPYSVVLERLSMDLHTGRTNIIWAIILGIASLNILFFIYTGFVITFKRTKTKIKNRYKAENADIVILVGSENGSTLFFANQIHKQLLADGKRSFLTEMNQYTSYPKVGHILIFTSTYGLGDAPTNAVNFGKLVRKFPQNQNTQYSVIGFGSSSYAEFCGYAKVVDELLAEQSWANRFVHLHTVNDKSANEFVQWVHAWSEKALVALATAPALYSDKGVGLKKLKIVSKTPVTEDNTTFQIILRPISKVKFQSGDLLSIYPAGDNRERFYSIGWNGNCVQLMVKLFPGGLGSEYLYNLEGNTTIEARVLNNPTFHLPVQASSVTMIANGTGIAPFLGMIMENKKQMPIHLYAGFRHNNDLAKQYAAFGDENIRSNQLVAYHFAFSRENRSQYVMDLIRRDANFFIEKLENNGVIMICGALRMQQDVEYVLNGILRESSNKPLSYYKGKGLILTDCY